jgi:hypothetical protein
MCRSHALDRFAGTLQPTLALRLLLGAPSRLALPVIDSRSAPRILALVLRSLAHRYRRLRFKSGAESDSTLPS